jgi:hypothetical protein
MKLIRKIFKLDGKPFTNIFADISRILGCVLRDGTSFVGEPARGREKSGISKAYGESDR